VCLSAVVPAFAEQDIHSLSRALAGRLRRLSLCSLPVLKQSEGSLGSLISVAYSVRCRTWQPARSVILMLFTSLARFLGRRPTAMLRRHKVPLSAIHRHQICDHLASYRKRPSVSWFFYFSCSWWLSPHFHRKVCVRIAQERRLATGWIHSTPRFVWIAVKPCLFSSVLHRAPG
jgi:hypothetical protein